MYLIYTLKKTSILKLYKQEFYIQTKQNMNTPEWTKKALFIALSALICCTGFANENLFQQARKLQQEGQYNQAVEVYKTYLSKTPDEEIITSQHTNLYSDALVQMMNSYQSMGEPEACVTALREVFGVSPALQDECLRDFYSVMGYALSRTENMKEAEEIMLKAFTMPLHHATPERYFRDYAYAAAVFYSNPEYHNEVISWCQEALVLAQASQNTSGQQWVKSMLGSLYKRSGDLNKALDLFQQSMQESKEKKDDLGVLNSLHSLIDLFLYWKIPEYADMYASEAIRVEKNMTSKNPMVSTQTYINKGRALYQLGEVDSISFYAEEARKICEELPYNSGMVDVDLLNGIYYTEKGGDNISAGIKSLNEVTRHGTPANRAKALYQLSRTYLKAENSTMADIMLDSLYTLLNDNASSFYIPLDYEAIIRHYLKNGNQKKLHQYLHLMFKEQQAFNEQKLNFNLVETIVNLQTGKRLQDLKIDSLKQTNQRLWFIILTILSIIISCIAVFLFRKNRQQKVKLKKADENLTKLVKKLNQSNIEKEKIAQDVKEFLNNKDQRQELETLTPFILKESGETKFRQCFELLYPLFLPRLRERVPSVTRREELLSMLIILKQDNKNIAELLAIEPRSVLMLRHRFRQKIGMTSEYSLENFIQDLLEKE